MKALIGKIKTNVRMPKEFLLHKEKENGPIHIQAYLTALPNGQTFATKRTLILPLFNFNH